MVKTTTASSSDEDKSSFVNNTSFNLDVSDNPYIMSPPPLESPQKPLNYRLKLLYIILETLEDIIYNLIRDLMLILTSECLTPLLRKTYV